MPRKKTTRWAKVPKKNKKAMKLPDGLFTGSPKAIAHGLKKAASKKAKKTQYKSAMALLTFYINRSGSRLKGKDKARHEKAKVELRKVFKKV